MLKKILRVAIGLWLLLSLAAFSEFHYWRNAETYPVWMSKQLEMPFKSVNNSNIGAVMDYLDKVCGKNRGLMAVTEKKNGLFMRCDDSLTATAWLDGVYKLNADYQVKWSDNNESNKSN